MSILSVHDRRDLGDVNPRGLPARANGLQQRTNIFLPVLRDVPVTAFPVEAPAAARGRVLLVDDNDSVRETLADLLEAEGFVTVQASDAEQATALMRKGPAFDALVTDLSMPGADGITLIGQARQIQSEIPAILLTGYAEQVTSVAAGAGGNFHILRKPVEGDRLVDQITLLIQRPRSA
jgi:DNA-binding NtrC family response regulator